MVFLAVAVAEALRGHLEMIRDAHPEEPRAVPADLVTASASGLDPDLSPEAALCQVRRVAWERGLPDDPVRPLVLRLVGRPDLGFLEMPRVNVVRLNRDLDALRP